MRPYYEDARAWITIYHGDCREVLPTLSGVDLVLTDPPYGVDLKTDYATRQRSALAQCNDFSAIAGDDKPFDPSPLLVLKTRYILWGANYYAQKLPESPSWIIWDKRDGMSANDNADCELAWSNLGGPARIYRHRWNGMIKASEKDRRRVHPSQKPVALFRWCLTRANLNSGALVLDPYMGSGPVAQACKEMGYRYIGVELVEKYAEIAARRLQQEVMPL
jgi:site-specific DNA-methyltransferase (adenine-specific)